MIEIKEISPPQKLSGRSSLLVTFDYNENIVNTVKTFSPAVFNKKNLTWEISIIYLSKLLDALTFYDNIKLSLLKDDEITEISSRESLTDNEIERFKYKPFDHQITGINFLLENKKSLLLDSMGIGKSLEIMYMAEVLHRRGAIDHCLIICGVDSLRSNWKSEIQKFSKESVLVLGEKTNRNNKTYYDSVSARVEQLRKPIEEFFVVVNIATLRNDKIIEAISKGPNTFGMIAVDEIHRVANKSSQQGSNLLKLKSNYKVAATGTPITNSPISVYVPLSWTENDQATLTNYKAQYCNFGGFNNSQIIGYKNLELLQDELNHCSIRRTFDQVRGDMPKKTIEYEIVEMSDEHQKFYDAIKNGIKEEADKIDLNSSNILALDTRLRQATACPSVLTSQDIMSSKIERAVELAEEILEAGDKVVILGNFIEAAEKIAEYLSKYNPILCTGKIPDDVITRGVDNFRNYSNFNVLVGTHGKMGTGFSMPECHYMIIIDQPFTPSQFQQSIDRIYRITSDQPIFVKVLVCKDTYDERVREIVEGKQELSDYIVDGKPSQKYTDILKNAILSSL